MEPLRVLYRVILLVALYGVPLFSPHHFSLSRWVCVSYWHIENWWLFSANIGPLKPVTLRVNTGLAVKLGRHILTTARMKVSAGHSLRSTSMGKFSFSTLKICLTFWITKNNEWPNCIETSDIQLMFCIVDLIYNKLNMREAFWTLG